MKLVELCGLSRNAGGLFYAVSALCRKLKLEGVDLSVLGKDDPFVCEDRGAWGDVPTKSYKTFGPLESSLQLRRILNEMSPELVHLHGIWLDDQWAAAQWQKRTDRPVVVSPHGMLDPWALNNSAWKKQLTGHLFAKQALHNATCIHALCQSEADAIRLYGLKNPIAVIPNGVDLPELNGPRNIGSQKTLLYLGRIHHKKGIAELLDAWSRFSGDWKLVIAGWGDDASIEQLKTRISEADVVNAEFVGPAFGKDKEQLFRMADAFILPSFSEGLPVSILEAWSYRLPVLMTRFCNIPEGFPAGGAMEIDPCVDSILAGLQDISGMASDELDGMGMRGRELVESRFTWSRIAREMKDVYQWCLGGERPSCMVE